MIFKNYFLNSMCLVMKFVKVFSFLFLALFLRIPCSASYFKGSEDLLDNQIAPFRFINNFTSDQISSSRELEEYITAFKEHVEKAHDDQYSNSRKECWDNTFVELFKALKGLQSYLNERKFDEKSLRTILSTTLNEVPYINGVLIRNSIENSNLGNSIKSILILKSDLQVDKPSCLLTIWSDLAIFFSISKKIKGNNYKRLIYSITNDYDMDLSHIDQLMGNNDSRKALLLLLPDQYLQIYLEKEIQHFSEKIQGYKDPLHGDYKYQNLYQDLDDEARKILYLLKYFSANSNNLAFLDSNFCYESLLKIKDCLAEINRDSWYKPEDTFSNIFIHFSNILSERLIKFREDKEDEFFLSPDKVAELVFIYNNSKNKEATLKALKILNHLLLRPVNVCILKRHN